MLVNPLNVRDVIPLFQLPAVNRDTIISPWDYKQRYSLAIAFFHHTTCARCRNVLLDLAQHYQTYRGYEAEVLAVATRCSADETDQMRAFAEEHAIPFPILWDEHRNVGPAYLGDQTGRSQVGIFVCDRFGELYMQSVGDEADELPTSQDIGGWLEFIDMNCPECFPPSWR